MIEFDSWSFAYPDAITPVIRNATTAWAQGQRIVLRGDIGSGKSTLLAALLGMAPLSTGGRVDGTLRVRGFIPQQAGIAAMSAHVSYLPQLVEGFGVGATVEQDIAASLELVGMPPADMRQRVNDTAEGLGISHLLERKLERVSGGERQLVALAGALARNAPVLALDEPLAQLHPSAIRRVMAELDRRVASGATLILAEHESLPAQLSAARFFTLAGGQLAPGEISSPSVIEERQATPVGRVVLRAQNVLLLRDDREVICDASFEARQGEIVALVGANGSGKTTLLRGAAGFIKPARGKFDVSVGGQATASAGWSMLPQNASSFLFAETVEQEIALSKAQPALAGLEQFGLAGFLARHPRDLSAGQRQLLALLIANARQPALLLLDEPTRGLSQPQRAWLGAYLRQRAADGAALVMASHDLHFCASLADRVLQISEGRVSEIEKNALLA